MSAVPHLFYFVLFAGLSIASLELHFPIGMYGFALAAVLVALHALFLPASQKAKSGARRAGAGLKKEWTAVAAAKGKHPDPVKKSQEYAKAVSKVAIETTFSPPEHQYVIGDKPWKKIGGALKSFWDGVVGWLK